MARDLTFFPKPTTLNTEEDLELLVYKANSVAFGIDGRGNGRTAGEILSHSNNSFNSLSNLVLKILLTTKGSVPSEGNYGTSLNSLLRDAYNPETVLEDVALILLDTEVQVKELQVRDTNLGPEARLKQINTVDVSLLTSGSLSIVIALENEKGQTNLLALGEG